MKATSSSKQKKGRQPRDRNDVMPLTGKSGTLKQRMARIEMLTQVSSSADRTTVRRLVQTLVYSSSVAGGFLYAPSVGGITSWPDWTAESANFQRYRAMALRVTFFPIVNCCTSPTGNVGCPVLYTCSQWGGTAPLNGNEVAQGPDGRAHDGRKVVVAEVDWSVNPDAKLWTLVGSTIASDSLIGIGFGCPNALNRVNKTAECKDLKPKT